MFEMLIPKMRVKTVFDLDLERLYSQGFRGIITDLDNTLVGAKAPLATPELIAWFEKVKKAGFQLVIVSNNQMARVSTFATPLDIRFVHEARKPSNAPFRKAMQMMGLKSEETIVVGDQMLTDVYGGNRLGLFTVLVLPISIQDEGWGTRMNRRLEKIALARLRKKGLWLEEEHQQ
ncbi:YqeG family HAD IIIA-type phosphatase [Paenibacillus favisporus]|uniref:HAD superfamily phosphatase (TIGR01668 family) n=1 Tax=Paenibacillus favisporus TaxID=221028 RepID=A0ABV2EVB8_9BACL|nr:MULTISPECIES: YqeG family HAD IIIA-type phosphatase [Paenibacillus]MCM2999754.1 YqeG family HAD IIIA-type phosphatase [Paenibacillus cellulositrophicus]MEC0176065.1 YqeG family HAD IIIA-type phosphatase [Paenibacillus favisporus]